MTMFMCAECKEWFDFKECYIVRFMGKNTFCCKDCKDI